MFLRFPSIKLNRIVSRYGTQIIGYSYKALYVYAQTSIRVSPMADQYSRSPFISYPGVIYMGPRFLLNGYRLIEIRLRHFGTHLENIKSVWNCPKLVQINLA